MGEIFKNKAKKEGVSVTDLVLTILQLLIRDLQAVVNSIKLVELWDKGQLSHIIKFRIQKYRNIGIYNILIY